MHTLNKIVCSDWKYFFYISIKHGSYLIAHYYQQASLIDNKQMQDKTSCVLTLRFTLRLFWNEWKNTNRPGSFIYDKT